MDWRLGSDIESVVESEMIKLLRDAVKEGFASVTWILFLASLVSALVGAFLGSYLRKWGELRAVSDSFNQSLDELKKQTKEVERIKGEFSEDFAKFEADLREHEVIGESELEFRKIQLAEFYGPIYAYSKLNTELYNIWMAGKLQDINKEIIALFRKNNEEVMRILATKLHLVDGSEVPPHFVRFATSLTLWNIYTAREKEPWVPDNIAALPQLKYPRDFEKYISDTTARLKLRLTELYDKYVIG